MFLLQYLELTQYKTLSQEVLSFLFQTYIYAVHNLSFFFFLLQKDRLEYIKIGDFVKVYEMRFTKTLRHRDDQSHND